MFRKTTAIAGFLALALCASAQVLNDFSSFSNSNTTFFKGSWTIGGDQPIATFTQGAGFFDFSGGTNSSDSGVDFFFMKPDFTDIAPLNLGTNRTLQFTGQLLAGNAASSMVLILSDNSPSTRIATATIDLSSISAASLTTVTANFTAQAGFDWSAVQYFTITGGVTGGSSALNVRFDNLAVIPETQTYAVILGALTLGFVGVRRFRKSAK